MRGSRHPGLGSAASALDVAGRGSPVAASGSLRPHRRVLRDLGSVLGRRYIRRPDRPARRPALAQRTGFPHRASCRSPRGTHWTPTRPVYTLTFFLILEKEETGEKAREWEEGLRRERIFSRFHV